MRNEYLHFKTEIVDWKTYINFISKKDHNNHIYEILMMMNIFK